jgi:predicted AlkP superfamily pyrophosphatase or phosphodiesterase
VRPRLVLVIVVDQFRYDFLERFGDLFAANGGLRRLMRDGASWTNANYDHMPTETAPGHATIMTGAWPSETGIIGNEWYDRDVGRRVSNAIDESVRLFGGGAEERASSPRRLLVSTVGDELRLATSGRSKVIGISVKDRGAILPAGRHASAAYWFSSQMGRMVSSSYYFPQMPAWVERFNETRPADKYFGMRWERLLPEAEYLRRAGADAATWENTGADKDKDTNTFPHTITGGASAAGREFYEAIETSPFANEMLVDFAREALTNEALGADDDTDVLSVSFSANDYVGHRFGPYSHEAMDVTLRSDRQIGALLDFVEQRVGLRNTLVVFTGDHGVAPVPEHAASLNLPGRRINPAEIVTAIKNGIRARYVRAGETKDTTADYVEMFTPKNGNLYFNTVALKRDGISREEIERVAGEAAMTVPGIARYFTRTQLERGAISPADAVARRVLHGFNARRSGDVVIVNQPFHLVVTYTADHFSPYSYDTHVPVILMGSHLNAGRYTNPAAPSDIAPTISAILRLQPPSSATGRILVEGMKQP